MIAAPPERKAPRPAPAWADRLGRARSPWPYRRRLWIAAAVAFSLHAAVYFASRESMISAAEFAIGDPAPSLEMELVAGEESAEPEDTPEPPAPEPMPEPPATPVPPPEVPTPPEPMPEPEPTPEPIPEPAPVPEPVKEEMVEPTPEPPKPKPKPKPAPKLEAKPVAKPSTPRPATATGAINPGPSGVAASGSPGGTGRSRGGKSSGPGYLSNPKPPYPAESRAAGEQGLTQLRVMLDTSGRPTTVSVSRSSGHNRLDVAAREAVRRWRFKPAMRDGQPIPSSVDVPVRWSLR